MNETKFMIVLQPVEERDLEEFKKGVQEAFSEAVVKEFGSGQQDRRRCIGHTSGDTVQFAGLLFCPAGASG